VVISTLKQSKAKVTTETKRNNASTLKQN